MLSKWGIGARAWGSPGRPAWLWNDAQRSLKWRLPNWSGREKKIRFVKNQRNLGRNKGSSQGEAPAPLCQKPWLHWGAECDSREVQDERTANEWKSLCNFSGSQCVELGALHWLTGPGHTFPGNLLAERELGLPGMWRASQRVPFAGVSGFPLPNGTNKGQGQDARTANSCPPGLAQPPWWTHSPLTRRAV